MNKKYIAAALIMLVGMAGTLAYLGLSNGPENVTDNEIKDKYCHVTTDVRKTDVYCQNPGLYRQNVRENKVIQD